MEYPILISGEAAGVLNTRRDGLYTAFEASLPPQPRLTRLWLTGADGAFCLGLMEPGAGGLTLLALPCALRRRTPGLRLALVDGREYMVFIY